MKVVELLIKMRENFGDYPLKYCLDFWKSLTHDKFVLDTIQDLKLEFICKPIQKNKPHMIKMKQEEIQFMQNKIPQMLANGTARECSMNDSPKWLINVFFRPKKQGSFRIILNLKNLNSKLRYCRFQMDTIYSVIRIVSRNMVMASIDLTEAYFHLGIFEQHKPYMSFEWQ